MDYSEAKVREAELQLEMAKQPKTEFKITAFGKLAGSSIAVHAIWAVVTVKVCHMIFVENGWIIK